MAAELTDITSVRQFMQKSVSDTLQDEDLEVLILEASEAIERTCNREFGREDATLRSFEFYPNNGIDLVDLTPYEYRSVASVVMDPDLTPVTLTESQYREGPNPARDGSYFTLTFAELAAPVLPAGLSSSPPYPYGTRRVDVTADWGLGRVPAEVQKACNTTVRAWASLGRGPGPGPGDQFGENAPIRGYDLPPDAGLALRRWMRPTPSA